MPSSLLMRAKEYRTSAKDHKRHGHIEYSEMGRSSAGNIVLYACEEDHIFERFKRARRDHGRDMVWCPIYAENSKVVRTGFPSKQEKQKGKPGFLCGPLLLSGTIYLAP